MRTFTIEDIRSWHPCYDPRKYLGEDWSGTALDILAVKDCEIADRLWVVLREEVLNANTLSRIACRFVRETPLGDGRTVWDLLTDERSRRGVEAREEYLRGEIDDKAMAADRAAARDAAWADRAAAWFAAGDAWFAASAAARDAASAAQLQIAKEEIERDQHA